MTLIIGFIVTLTLILLLFIASVRDHKRRLREYNQKHKAILDDDLRQTREIYRKHSR